MIYPSQFVAPYPGTWNGAQAGFNHQPTSAFQNRSQAQDATLYHHQPAGFHRPAASVPPAYFGKSVYNTIKDWAGTGTIIYAIFLFGALISPPVQRLGNFIIPDGIERGMEGTRDFFTGGKGAPRETPETGGSLPIERLSVNMAKAEKLRELVVQLQPKGGSPTSGLFIDERHILANLSGLQDPAAGGLAEDISLTLPGTDRQVRATVIYQGELPSPEPGAPNLALLKLEEGVSLSGNYAFPKFREELPKQGEFIWMWGMQPWNSSKPILVEGVVSNLNATGAALEMPDGTIWGAVPPGASLMLSFDQLSAAWDTPVFDLDGRIVGWNADVNRDAGLNFAYSAPDVKAFINQALTGNS